MPIRVRLTLWYAVLLAAIIAGLGGFVVVQLRNDLEAVIDRELNDRVTGVTPEYVEEISDERSRAGVAEDFRELCGSAAPGPGTAAQLLAAGGEILASCAVPGQPQPVIAPELRADAAGGTRRLVTVPGTSGPERWRAVVAPIEASRGRRGALVLGNSLEEVDDAVERVLVLLLLAGPAALVATALGGWLLARKALRPVETMTSRAREIGIEQLDERIPVPRTKDEIGQLGSTLNAMLERLERGVEEKHALVADASHELRTPLAIMRVEIDVSLRGDDLSAEARAVLESARHEVDKMSRTVDNLLTLAQVDEGRLELLTQQVDLRETIELAVRPLQPLAADKGVRLQVEGQARPVKADPERVQQALTNFVENAIKFARHDGEVRVTAWDGEDEVGVTVADDGPGIPADAGEHVFDRYYRAESGRGSPAGSGLGLAICREVALAHGGRVWVEHGREEGSAFSLALPTTDGS